MVYAVVCGLPLAQMSLVHGLPSKGTSLSSVDETRLPFPSQTDRRQSPLGSSSGTTPSLVGLRIEHTPCSHTRSPQPLPAPGQSLRDPEAEVPQVELLNRTLDEIDSLVGHLHITVSHRDAAVSLDGKPIDVLEAGTDVRVEP